MKSYKLPLIDGREIEFNTIGAEDADRYMQAIVSSDDSVINEEVLFNIVTDNKYVDILDTLEAGIVLIVVYAAFSLSGVLNDIKDFVKIIEESREKINNKIYNLLYIPILKAMPSYKLSELKAHSLNELLELFAISEAIIGTPAVNTEELRKLLGVSSKKKEKPQFNTIEPNKSNALTKDQLDSLTAKLREMENADFDDMGRFIGDGNLM